MKKFLFGFVMISTLVSAAPALAADLTVNASGNATIETYVFRLYGMWGRPVARENDEVKARPRAMEAARVAAKKLFEETCRNSKNGVASDITVINAAAPGKPSACEVEWQESDKGTISCNARARGKCTVREGNDSRVAGNAVAPTRELVIDGHRYLLQDAGPVGAGRGE